MQFSFTAIALFGALFLGATAAPVDLAARALSSQAYDELSISAGTAGTGKEEALAKIPIDMTDLAAVSAADLKIIDNIHKVANAAETGAFNAAIKAATGDAATALQVRLSSSSSSSSSSLLFSCLSPMNHLACREARLGSSGRKQLT
jgi:hypothetical protein